MRRRCKYLHTLSSASFCLCWHIKVSLKPFQKAICSRCNTWRHSNSPNVCKHYRPRKTSERGGGNTHTGYKHAIDLPLLTCSWKPLNWSSLAVFTVCKSQPGRLYRYTLYTDISPQRQPLTHSILTAKQFFVNFFANFELYFWIFKSWTWLLFM